MRQKHIVDIEYQVILTLLGGPRKITRTLTSAVVRTIVVLFNANILREIVRKMSFISIFVSKTDNV